MAAQAALRVLKQRIAIQLLGFALTVSILATLVFFVGGWIASSIPRNPDWREPETGITILVADNGLHTELVLPIVTPEEDWRQTFPALYLPRDDGQYPTHVAIGWGEKDVFLHTPTWSDLKPATVWHIAIHGGSAIIRLTPFVRPAPDRWYRPLRLRPDEYRRLVRSILGSLPPLPLGSPRQSYRGFDPSAFNYDALGRYTFANSCNQWTSNQLAAAGVRTGYWTPFSGGVMKWVPQTDP
ncbi:DUF2459 domain-containing protein [Qipengyuania algicida]|uniref:DUF2459 domain-containing protein n=1 Tax=Qipengyuania algicida TaxID=1836209 RepID=UPI00301DF44F